MARRADRVLWADETGVTVIVATHDPKILEYADAVHAMRDGRVVAE